MNFFDFAILGFLNRFSQDSHIFDKAVAVIGENGLLKGGVLMALIWYAWFRSSDSKDRTSIISLLLASIGAMAVARTLALCLPFRLRPLHEDGLDFQLPHGLAKATLDGWSSFPSDHAVLFFTLSVGLLFVSRALGLFAVLYTLLVIGLPRVYLGLHYPTDILAGALLGAAFAVAGHRCLADTRLVRWIVGLSQTSAPVVKPASGRAAEISIAGIFYPLFFLFSYQVADMFSATRAMLKAFGTLVRSVL